MKKDLLYENSIINFDINEFSLEREVNIKTNIEEILSEKNSIINSLSDNLSNSFLHEMNSIIYEIDKNTKKQKKSKIASKNTISSKSKKSEERKNKYASSYYNARRALKSKIRNEELEKSTKDKKESIEKKDFKLFDPVYEIEKEHESKKEIVKIKKAKVTSPLIKKDYKNLNKIDSLLNKTSTKYKKINKDKNSKSIMFWFIFLVSFFIFPPVFFIMLIFMLFKSKSKSKKEYYFKEEKTNKTADKNNFGFIDFLHFLFTKTIGLTLFVLSLPFFGIAFYYGFLAFVAKSENSAAGIAICFLSFILALIIYSIGKSLSNASKKRLNKRK